MRRGARHAVASVVALGLGAAAQPGAVAAAGGPDGADGAARWKFYESSFALRMRAAAIEPELDVPYPLVSGVGYSSVSLDKDVGMPVGVCESRGIGAHVADVVEQGVLSPEGGGVSELFNPTEARDRKPDRRSDTNFDDRSPQLRGPDGTALYDIPAHGDGVRWEAECVDDSDGHATATDLDVGTARSAGSTTAARIDKATGRFTGISRAFVAGLTTPSGTLDLVSSVLRVDALPGREPTVGYRISTTDGTLAAGVDVPLGDLPRQFNDAVRADSAAVAALGPLGLTLLGPTVSTSASGAPVLHTPFLEVSGGLEARRATVGQDTRLRLVSAAFEGGYFQ